MKVSVDTNILLDVLIPNQQWLESSLQKLNNASKKDNLIICEIVYVELSSQFEKSSDLNSFLTNVKVELIFNNEKSLFLASRLWQKYLKDSEKQKHFCFNCGKEIHINCSHCGREIKKPRRVLNDFITGAHASIFSEKFLTRDRGFYRYYFEGLEIIE